MVALAFAVGFAVWAGVWLGSILGGLGISPVNIAAASLLGTLVGLVFGGIALVLSAATGRVRIATFGAIGIGLVAYLVNSIAILNDTIDSLAVLTPFNYYLTNQPLSNGMEWGNLAVLVIVFAALIVAAVALFDRRDLRQSA